MGAYKRASSGENDSWYTSAKRSRLHHDDSNENFRESDYQEETGQEEKQQSTGPRPGENRHQQGKRKREENGNIYDTRGSGKTEAINALYDNPADQPALPIFQSLGAYQNNLSAKGRGTLRVCFRIPLSSLLQLLILHLGRRVRKHCCRPVLVQPGL